MSRKAKVKNSKGVWFVYDGDCPICSMTAQAWRIKQATGALHLLNARQNRLHPWVIEVNKRKLDLDEGMVLIYQENFYHGDEALQLMALLGSNKGWFNRIIAWLFTSRAISRSLYPILRAGRNGLLRLKGVKKIRNLDLPPDQPIFQTVFGDQWSSLPPVMKDHYAVRPYSDDKVTVKGTLDVQISMLMSVMARFSGMLLAHSGKNVPVTVDFTSGKSSNAFHFRRTFHFPNKGPVTFHSHMEHLNDNVMVEFMRFGVGWKLAFNWDGEKVILSHLGYVWRILGFLIPLPMALIIGKGHAEEHPLSDDTFAMWTHSNHPWFGKTFAYAGIFKVTEVSCNNKS